MVAIQLAMAFRGRDGYESAHRYQSVHATLGQGRSVPTASVQTSVTTVKADVRSTNMCKGRTSHPVLALNLLGCALHPHAAPPRG